MVTQISEEKGNVFDRVYERQKKIQAQPNEQKKTTPPISEEKGNVFDRFYERQKKTTPPISEEEGNVFDRVAGKDPYRKKSFKETFSEIKEVIPFFMGKPSSVKSIAKAAAHGALDLTESVEGIVDFFDPFSRMVKEKAFKEKSRKELRESIGKPDEGLQEEVLRKGIGNLHFAMGGGAGLLAKAGQVIGPTLAEQIVKEAGGGPGLQAVAGGGAGFVRKGIFSKGLSKVADTEKPLLKFMERFGATEAEATPLIQRGRKIEVLGPVAKPNRGTKEILANTEESIGNIYGKVLEKGKKLPRLEKSRKWELYREFNNQIDKLPATHNIPELSVDLKKLLSGPLTPDKLVEFSRNVGSMITKDPNLKALKTLQDIAKKILRTHYPEYAKDAELLNKMFSRFYKISGELAPKKTMESVIQLTKAAVVGKQIFSGSLKAAASTLVKVSGASGARRFIVNLLTKPAYQNLIRKAAGATKKNAPIIIKHIQNKVSEAARRQAEKYEGFRKDLEKKKEKRQKEKETDKSSGDRFILKD